MRRRRSKKIIPTITLTPLIDTAFTILIIFMVAASGALRSLSVSVPEALGGQQVSSRDERIAVCITSLEEITVDGKATTYDSLSELLAHADHATPVYIVADGNAVYRTILKVAGKIKECGFQSLALTVKRS